MQFQPSILDSIRSTIDSGYYERLSPVRRERKSLCESLEHELEEGRLPFIFEVAVAQPDYGLIIPNRIEAAKLMGSLASLAPAAMSIWVEPKHCAGDLRWLSMPWKFPIIVRDFVINPRQIVGGDAIVLSRRLLAMAGCDAHSLIDIAHELDMEVVLEVCTLEDMDYARSSEADVIAIRNDWTNGNKAAFGNGELSAGISNSLFLLSSSKTSRPVISCAQVSTPAHVRQLAAAGAWGIEIDAKTASASNFALIFGSLKKAINGKGPLFEKKHQE